MTMREAGLRRGAHRRRGQCGGPLPRRPATPGAPYLLTGSHYDTVRNGGKYDGRLGIYVPWPACRSCTVPASACPSGMEMVAFAEEEGQRYKATFLASGALVGSFNPAWLDQHRRRRRDHAPGHAARRPARHAGGHRGAQARPGQYLGFVEVHIEQGPVLNELNLPLGVVTSINGSVRYHGRGGGHGQPRRHHAHGPPRRRRLRRGRTGMLYVEQRARRDGDSVGTVGQLNVPNGSVNVVPGRCPSRSTCARPPTPSATPAGRRAGRTARHCERRGVRFTLEETMRASAAPSAPAWQARWEQAVQALGLPVHRLPSGAGHDAMKLHDLMPQAMLFVRGRTAASATTRSNPPPAKTWNWPCAPSEHLLQQVAAGV
jgi:beta-ureidopropionase / N-carbamoyl-L-amino-acid hydrolase